MVRWIGVAALCLLGGSAGVGAAAQTTSPPALLIPCSRPVSVSEGRVKVLATNAASSWFATLGEDEMLCFWNAADAQFLAQLPANGVEAVAVLPKSHLAVLAYDRFGEPSSELRLVDVDTFTTVKTLRVDDSMRWLQSTADGRLFAVGFHGLYRIDPATLAPTRLAGLGEGTFSQAVLNEEGSLLAVTSQEVGKADVHVQVFATSDGSRRFARDVRGASGLSLSGNLLAMVSPDERRASDSYSGHVLVLDVGTGAVVTDAPFHEFFTSLLLKPVPGHETELIAATGGATERVNLATGKVLQRTEKNEAFLRMAWVGGKLVAAGGSGVPNLCDPLTLQCKEAVSIQGIGVTQARALPGGGLLLMDMAGNAITLNETLQSVKLYSSPTLAVIPRYMGKEGLFGISRSDDLGTETWVNDILAPSDPAEMLPLEPFAFAVSQDGRFAAMRKRSSPVRSVTAVLYDLAKLKSAQDTPAPLAEWKLASEDKNSTDSTGATGEFEFAFTPDARTLVAVDKSTGSVHRFDSAMRRDVTPANARAAARPASEDEFQSVSAWALAESGRQVAVGWFDSVSAVALDGEPNSAAWPLGAAVRSIVAGRDGYYFIGLEDGAILRWDGHAAPVPFGRLPYGCGAMIYLPGRNLLLANAADGIVHLLDGDSGLEKMAVLLFANQKDWLVWTPAGMFDASDRGARGVRWKLAANTFAPAEPMEDLFDEFYVPGLASAVLAGNPPKPPVLKVRERRAPEVQVTATAPRKDGTVMLNLSVSAPAGVRIQDLHLFRNGVLLKVWEGALASGTHHPFTARLVAGKNDFTAYAFNQDDVKSVDGLAEATGPDSLKRAGELYVIAIGVNAYRNAAFHLNFATQDAVLAGAALKAQRQSVATFGRQIELQQAAGGSSNVGKFNGIDLLPSLGDPHLTMLLDGDATRERILKTIAEVGAQAKPEDAVVVFFAGHGVAVGDRYYLLPQDFDFAGTPSQLLAQHGTSLERSAISDVDLRTALSHEEAAVAALILDACQSGELVGDQLAQRRGPMNSRGLAQLAYDKRLYILAASLSTQTAAEQAALEHGVLTYALIEEGLVEDRASAQQTVGIYVSSAPQGGTTTLNQWLHWGAGRVTQTANSPATLRGFPTDQKKVKSQWLPVQQPRLFTPPEGAADVIVAVSPISLDPLALATARTGAVPAPAAASHPSGARVAAQELLFQPSTLDAIDRPAVHPGGGTMLGITGGRIVALDLDHGDVLWREPVGGKLLSFDTAPNGELAALDQFGNVFLIKHGATPAVTVFTQLFGFNAGGTVRWLQGGDQLLVVVDKQIALYSRAGEKIKSIPLPGYGLHDPVVSAKGDWLYLGDVEGRILSYQLPSLTPGPISTSLTSLDQQLAGRHVYVSSIAIDEHAQTLLRIHSDGTFAEFQLPSLLPVTNPSLPHVHLAAALYAADGKTCYLADDHGNVLAIDTASGSVKTTWPSLLSHVDALSSDSAGVALVASGEGGLTAWNIATGAVRTHIPGQRYFPVAHFTGAGGLEGMLAGNGTLRSFHLGVEAPAEPNESVPLHASEFYFSQHRMIGKLGSQLTLWDSLHPDKSRLFSIPGDGTPSLTADGRYLGWAPARMGSSSMQLFDTATGMLRTSLQLPGQAGSEILSNDGKSVLSVSGEVLTETTLLPGGATLSAKIPQAPCCTMVLSPAGDQLLLADSQAGQVLLFGMAARRVLRSVELPDILEFAEFVPQSDVILLVTRGGSVYAWPSLTGDPVLLGSVDGAAIDISLNTARTTALVSTNFGKIGWFSLGPGSRQLATSTWLEATHSWLTLAADGRFSVNGDRGTPLGIPAAGATVWKPASQQPGFSPQLLQELLAR